MHFYHLHIHSPGPSHCDLAPWVSAIIILPELHEILISVLASVIAPQKWVLHTVAR